MPQIQKPQFNRVRKDDGNGGFILAHNGEAFKQAACAGTDTEFFYPNKDSFTDDERRIFEKMCGSCPILDMCKEWALVHERFGVWGGMVPIDRERMRRRLGWKLMDPMTNEPRSFTSYYPSKIARV